MAQHQRRVSARLRHAADILAQGRALSKAGKGHMHHLSRRVLIHVCKDGTFTYRIPPAPVFNGLALPVYSVDTEDEAQALQVRLCRLQRTQHPQMRKGEPWYTLSTLGDDQDPALCRPDGLELADLEIITELLDEHYQALLRHRADEQV